MCGSDDGCRFCRNFGVAAMVHGAGDSFRGGCGAWAFPQSVAGMVGQANARRIECHRSIIEQIFLFVKGCGAGEEGVHGVME